MKNKLTCIFILGMHRSGTSCLTGTLYQYNLFLGKVSKKNTFNLKGNYENSEITLLNNELLEYNNGSWDNPPTQINWTNKHLVKQKEIIYSYEKYYKIIGLKDPRFLITLPFWEQACETIKFIGVFRHPSFVAESLYIRNNIPINHGLDLWFIYNLKLLKIITQKNFPILSFDESKDEFLFSVHRALKYIGLNYLKVKEPFYEEKLIHYSEQIRIKHIPSKILSLYKKLIAIYKAQSHDF